MSTEYVAGRRPATARDVELFRDFIEHELGGRVALKERAHHQRAGMNYVEAHREEIYKEFDGEWVAADETGVVAHASKLPVLKEQLMAQAEDSPYKHWACGRVYIEYCERQKG